MYKKTLLSIAIASSLALSGCLNSGTNGKDNANALSPSTLGPANQAAETAAASVVTPLFDPAKSVMPIPNDILFESTNAAKGTVADGTMFVSNDATNPVYAGIDHMDGNSVTGQIDIKMSGSLDPASVDSNAASSFIQSGSNIIPNPNQSVFLLPLTYPGGDQLLHAKNSAGSDIEIPTFLKAKEYQQWATEVKNGDNTHAADLVKLATPVARAEVISLDGGTNNVLRITPLKPLMPKTKYLVVVTNRLKDASGAKIQASQAYKDIRDNNTALLSNALLPLRAAEQGWETLAAGYFAFMSQVYTSAGLTSLSAPSKSDIALSYTFTTGGTTTVLRDIASPSLFFKDALTVKYKQAAIAKLVAGTYNLNSDNAGLKDASDIAINTTIASQWTANAALLSNSKATKYSDLTSATDQYIAQNIAASVAYAVYNSGDTTHGDNNAYTIAQEAAGAVAGIQKAGGVFPTPESRTTLFYRSDEASSINSSLAAPAKIAQGEITIPYYLKTPASKTDGSNITNGTWEADSTLGAVIDAALGNASGTTPPSSKITYRYPFPKQQSSVTVPIIVTYPDVSVINLYNAYHPSSTLPTSNWPVIIYQHGITTDRSATLPMADILAASCLDLATLQAYPVDSSKPSTYANAANWKATSSSCFATVAMDQPLHGFTPSGSLVPGLYSVNDPDHTITPNINYPGTSTAVTLSQLGSLEERHFNFTADAKLQPTPMVYSSKASDRVGSSGSLFTNLANFANSRDNLREAALDLLNVSASLGKMDVDGDGTPDLDTSKVYFIGHSLGGIDGIPFVATNNNADVQATNTNLPKIRAASLLNTGGEVTKLLENSPSPYFGAPVVLNGLLAKGLAPGTSNYETYMNVLQGVIDSGDAVNYAAGLGANGDTKTGILLTDIVGGAALTNTPIKDTTNSTDTKTVYTFESLNNPSDQTIPNCADTTVCSTGGPNDVTLSNGTTFSPNPAPLAGGLPIVSLFGATDASSGTISNSGNPVVAVTKFSRGSHGTPVSAGSPTDPYSSYGVFLTMISETASLFTSNGTAIVIPSATYVKTYDTTDNTAQTSSLSGVSTTTIIKQP
jgi:hypothetical protein